MDYKRRKKGAPVKLKHPLQKRKGFRKARWVKERATIDQVEKSLQELKPKSITSFHQIPLSSSTQKGLVSSGFTSPTDIQREAIPISLRRGDLLGTAKTGSGKTLAFVIPLLECLWREQWTSLDGVGAIVISPTRELAFQTFEVLKKVGSEHEFSAGLIIGGKDISEEQSRICTTNILICTPGRLLQHMDETPSFLCSNLKILILDEADRILDLGFKDTLDSIMENLPTSRQTLLFSATLNKHVLNLARLSLNSPEYVSVHAGDLQATPSNLTQSYVVCPLDHKLDFLFSFVKAHLKSKVIVFMSTCKQVRFVYETFRRMRPGIPLLALFGRINQTRRMCVYQSFFQRDSAILFATDIAARGLDFPKVHWVVQLDCPPNTDEYIHRVGRTARYHSGGQALLVLLPSEAQFVELLEKSRLSLNQIKPNRAQLFSISQRLAYFCAEDSMIKYWAQRAYINYVKSVAKEGNKGVFDITQLPFDNFALSLGLPVAPKVRYLSKHLTVSIGEKKGTEGDCQDIEEVREHSPVTDSLLKVKRKQVEMLEQTSDANLPPEPKKVKIISKVSSSKKLLKKNIKLNSRLVFDEDGNIVEATKFGKKVKPSEMSEKSETDFRQVKGGLDLIEAKRSLDMKLTDDKEKDRLRVNAKHRKQKKKLKDLNARTSMDNEIRLKVSNLPDSDTDLDASETSTDNVIESENEIVERFVSLRDTERKVLSMIGQSL